MSKLTDFEHIIFEKNLKKRMKKICLRRLPGSDAAYKWMRPAANLLKSNAACGHFEFVHPYSTTLNLEEKGKQWKAIWPDHIYPNIDEGRLSVMSINRCRCHESRIIHSIYCIANFARYGKIWKIWTQWARDSIFRTWSLDWKSHN
jgi:hypothetical protein